MTQSNAARGLDEAGTITGAGNVEDLLRTLAREETAKAALAQAVADTWTAAERINSIVETEAVK